MNGHDLVVSERRRYLTLDEDEIFARALRLMEEERRYLDPYVTMEGMAEEIGVHRNAFSAADFSASDLMMAAQTGVTKTNNPVPLVFSHKLAMVEVSIKDGDEMWEKMGRGENSMPQVAMKGCATETSFNLATGAVATPTTITEIAMLPVTHYSDDVYTYRAVIPAQSIASAQELFSFNFSSPTAVLKHTTTGAVSLAAGQAQPFDITIDVTLDPDHAYAIGDAYPHKGLPIGVVFEISDDGTHGKIVSLVENAQSWSNASTWCSSLGSGWVLSRSG